MRLLHLKNIEYWACVLGVGLGGLISLVLTYTAQLDFFVIEKEPILVRMSFPVETSKEGRRSLISEFTGSLQNFDQIKEVETYIGKADEDVGDLANIYSSEVLFELLLHDQWQSRSKKKILITELSESGFNYPEVVLKVLSDKFHPAVLTENILHTTQMKFIPNKNLLVELKIPETELNKELEAYMRLASDLVTFQDVQAFNFITSDGMSIPFSALGKYETISIQHNLKDLPSGHWEVEINNDEAEKNEVIMIVLDAYKLHALGQQLSSVENKIKEELEFLEKDIDIQKIRDIIVLERNDYKILLRDIANIVKTYSDVAQINTRGLQYMIRLHSR